MKTIIVKLAQGRSYPVRVGTTLGDLGSALKLDGGGRRLLVVSSLPIARRFGARVLASLKGAGMQARLALMRDGESAKNPTTLMSLYSRAVEAGLDRTSTVVALGGGVVGDVAGFLAATYMRGIPWVNCPTTLLSMVDASIGGKTGVDLPEGKNLIGAFWQPRAVWMDVSTLDTLPERQWRTGMAEILKYGLIADPRLWKELESSHAASIRDSRRLEAMISTSVAIKAAVVGRDERETTGARAVLNLGHTFGHAIETVTGYRAYTHGEAVAIGLCAAARLGVRLGTFSREDVGRVDRTVARWGLPVKVRSPLARRAVVAAMARDKKSVDGNFRFVVPVGIGKAKVVTGVPINMVYETLSEVGL